MRDVLLGFTYYDHQKTYYIDGHECEDVVLYQNQFCKRYSSDYEPWCMHWIQLKMDVINQYPGLKNSGAGYHYMKNNLAMCKYNINTTPDDNNMKEDNGINIL